MEDKARAKDVKGKKVAEGGSSAHVVQRNHPRPQKKKNQQDVKPKNTTSFKKKKFNCFTCGKLGHFAGLDLILKFNLVKGSKCHVCVETKQPHKATAARLASLELIDCDLCEMNGELTKGAKRYFVTFIDDCTRFCYVYMLKIKG
jgi:hypothetical protein